MNSSSTSNQDPAALEREADARRASLNQTLNAVEERFSPNHLAKQAVDYFGDHGGDIAQSVGQSVKQNPLPLLLTGIGLAWLITSQSRSSSYNDGSRYPDSSSGWEGERYRAERTPRAYAQNAFSVAENGVSTNPDSSVYGSHDSDSDDDSLMDDAKDKVDSLKRSASQLRDDLTEKLRSVKQESGETVEQWRERVINTSVEQADNMDQQYRQARQQMIARSQQAKQEMMARSRQAKQEMMTHGREYVQSTKNWMQDQPLVAGALGVAAGALIGTLLPSSKVEDELIGDRADNIKSSLAHRTEVAGEEAASAVADKAQKLREKGETKLDQVTS